MIHLRPAHSGDAHVVWEWANDSVTRAASFQTAPIPWHEHETWFSARLRDDRCRFFIAVDDDRPIGQVRMTVEGDRAEVHISLAPLERGRGHGLTMLRQACAEAERSGLRGLVAHVKPSNTSSIALFERAGFSRHGSVTQDGHEALRFEWFAHAATPTPRVLFVVDGTATTGLGHVVRCSALAAALKRSGVASTFLAGGHPGVKDKVVAVGATHVRDSRGGQGTIDVDEILGVARATQSSAIVVDSYFADAGTLQALHAAGFVLIVLDDLAGFEISADLVVNGSAHASTLRYRTRSTTTRLLLGPIYALLREPFWQASPRVSRPRVADVLVTMGGGNTGALALPVVAALDDVDVEFDLAVMQSALAPPLAITPTRHRARTLVDPLDVRSCLAQADLAVCAGGQTIYELAAVGTPAVAVQVSSNQAGSLAAMAASGVLRAVGALDDADVWQSMRRAVAELCERHDERQAMSAAGQRLVDGRGAVRVAEAVADLVRTRARDTRMAEAR